MTILQLALTECGAGPPVAILHGLFGSGRNWTTVAQRLAATHRVLAIDLRNHGASPWAETMDYAEMADDVVTTLRARSISRCALIGHSMGGKVAMLAALAHSDCVKPLIIVDIAPVSYPARHGPFVRAMQAIDLRAIKRRADADERLAAYVRDAGERGFLLQNLVFEPNKPPYWRLNLDAIDREMSTLAGMPTVQADVMYRGPALFVAGDRSDYVLPEYEPAIARLFPNVQIVRIAGAGHWPHVEQPQAFITAVERFLTAATG